MNKLLILCCAVGAFSCGGRSGLEVSRADVFSQTGQPRALLAAIDDRGSRTLIRGNVERLEILQMTADSGVKCQRTLVDGYPGDLRALALASAPSGAFFVGVLGVDIRGAAPIHARRPFVARIDDACRIAWARELAGDSYDTATRPAIDRTAAGVLVGLAWRLTEEARASVRYVHVGNGGEVLREQRDTGDIVHAIAATGDDAFVSAVGTMTEQGLRSRIQGNRWGGSASVFEEVSGLEEAELAGDGRGGAIGCFRVSNTTLAGVHAPSVIAWWSATGGVRASRSAGLGCSIAGAGETILVSETTPSDVTASPCFGSCTEHILGPLDAALHVVPARRCRSNLPELSCGLRPIAGGGFFDAWQTREVPPRDAHDSGGRFIDETFFRLRAP